nr:hypothetical protein [Tanacetum cinerariifolium]
MSYSQTLVCVKHVKQEAVEEWDDSMPLPGDIIEGIAPADSCTFKGVEDKLFVPTKGKSELRSLLGQISKRNADGFVWLKVRRGDQMVNLRVCAVQEKHFRLQRKFSFRAVSNEKHVVVLDDLHFDQCTELQEMSRKSVNMVSRGFNQEAIEYNWRRKVATYLPDHRSTVVSSILFRPLANEHDIDSITSRAMAWFSAAVSSGTPIDKCNSTRIPTHGIRLWFLPGIEEIPIELIPESGENRFGIDIKRTDEGFVCLYAVTKDSAADRAGLRQLYKNSTETGHMVVLSRLEGKSVMPTMVGSDGLLHCCDNGHMVVLSRLEGKSVMPTMVGSDGLLHCCDNGDIRETLVGAVNQLETIQLHIMSWPNTQSGSRTFSVGAETLRPPVS